MLVQILQIRLVWSKIAYGKLNFHGNVVFVRRFEACANFAPHQSAQAKNSTWHEVCGVFFLCQAIRLSVRSIRLFPILDSTFDLVPDSASKNVKAWYRQCFDSKPPIPAYRLRDPGVFHSRCQSRFMDTCHTPRSHSDAKFLQERTLWISSFL